MELTNKLKGVTYRHIIRENTWWFRDEPSWPELVKEVFVFGRDVGV